MAVRANDFALFNLNKYFLETETANKGTADGKFLISQMVEIESFWMRIESAICASSFYL